MEVEIAKILGRLHIPYSGSSFKAIQISNNKLKTKRLFEKMHCQPPNIQSSVSMIVLAEIYCPANSHYLKTAFEHCSIGITNNLSQRRMSNLKIVQKLRKSQSGASCRRIYRRKITSHRAGNSDKDIRFQSQKLPSKPKAKINGIFTDLMKNGPKIRPPTKVVIL